ncbi:MAG: hypothetical protein ACI97A_003609, partial [Planctomycetota bacterium]
MPPIRSQLRIYSAHHQGVAAECNWMAECYAVGARQKPKASLISLFVLIIVTMKFVS